LEEVEKVMVEKADFSKLKPEIIAKFICEFGILNGGSKHFWDEFVPSVLKDFYPKLSESQFHTFHVGVVNAVDKNHILN